MSAVRTCPSCSRPSGPKYTRCMYCGAELPAVVEVEAPEPADEAQDADRAEAARRLLEGLTPEARAMMPADVLRDLERRASGGAGRTVHPRKEGTPTLSVVDGGRPAEVLRDPAPRKRAARSGGHLVAVPADAKPARPPSGSGPTAAALGEALTRGGGPFGPRGRAYRVVLLPGDYHGALHWLRHRLASRLGIDLYTATRHLQREVPTFLAACDASEQADTLAGPLREAGLGVVVLDRDALARFPGAFDAVSAEFDGDEPVFLDADGVRLEVARGGIAWAALGEIRPDRVALPTGKDARELLRAGGRSLSTKGGPYVVLELLRDDGRPVRVRSDRFDFRCLGDGRVRAAEPNLRRLLTLLGDDARPVPLDRSFRRVTHFDAPARAYDAEPAGIPRREVEFTEYVLLKELGRRAT